MSPPFLQFPDPRLRQPVKPVEKVDEAVRGEWQVMLAAMYAMPGVGLAGPQIGIMKRIAVLDCSDGHDTPVRLANPKILARSETLRAHEEGSPNVPGQFAKVMRAKAVTVKYLDDTGEEVTRVFEDLWSTSVQHQIDHLNGILFVDHLSPLKRRMILARHKKRLDRKAEKRV